MSGIAMMFERGVGVGAWVVGFLLVLALAFPAVALILSVIGRLLRIGRRED